MALTTADPKGDNHRMDDEQEPKTDKDMKLAVLGRVNGPVEAEVIKNFLESQGIACILQGQMLQSIYPDPRGRPGGDQGHGLRKRPRGRQGPAESARYAKVRRDLASRASAPPRFSP